MIRGYSYGHNWGAVLNSEGRAVADKWGHIGGDDWEQLQRVAYEYFYDQLKIQAGFPLDAIPKMTEQAMQWKLPEGASLVMSAEYNMPKKKWWRRNK
jgi:hypothetical protein